MIFPRSELNFRLTCMIQHSDVETMMISTKPHDKPRIGITLGDVNGIGPEVIIKALSDSRLLNLVTPVIYGSTRVLSFYRKLMNLEEFNYSQVKAKGQFFPKTINVVNCWDDIVEINPDQPDLEIISCHQHQTFCGIEFLREVFGMSTKGKFITVDSVFVDWCSYKGIDAPFLHFFHSFLQTQQGCFSKDNQRSQLLG